MKIYKVYLLTALIVLMLTSACAPNYKDKFMDKGKAEGWTEEQNLAAFAYTDRLYFLSKKPVDKQEFAVNYGLLKATDIRKKLEGLTKDVDEILDYKNEDNAKYLEIFDLRKDLEHEEKVLEATLARVRAYELDNQFQQLMGTGFYGANSQISGGYDIKKIFLSKNVVSTFSFNSDQIEDAKKRGVLQWIERGKFLIERKFDRKEPDPNALDDQNAFVWRDHKEELELTNYKILNMEKPDNNLGNYIEGFRIINNKKESLPALKIFFPQGGGTGIMVLDTDQEGRDPGFGVPDLLEKVSVSSIGDIMRNDQLLHRLFEEKKQAARVKPVAKPVNVEIARVGPPADVWQQSTDAAGWTVSFNYRNKLKDNYNVRIKLARPSHADMDPAQITEVSTSIEYIGKEWTGQDRYTPSLGAVVEFYRTVPPFDQKNINKADVLHMENTKKISIDFQDGNEKVGIVTPSANNQFIQDEPYAIEYTEGQKRYHIEKDNGSTVFNKKKEISLPKNANTGVYGPN